MQVGGMVIIETRKSTTSCTVYTCSRGCACGSEKNGEVGGRRVLLLVVTVSVDADDLLLCAVNMIHSQLPRF